MEKRTTFIHIIKYVYQQQSRYFNLILRKVMFKERILENGF